MRELDVTKIEVLSSGEMMVQPATSDSDAFEHIYRAGAGVRWDKDRQAFMTPRPQQLSYCEWFRRVSDAVAAELGVNLKVTDRTQLINVPTSFTGGSP
jgi:hypothetical protein